MIPEAEIGPDRGDGRDPNTLRTLQRGLNVLEALATSPSGLTFSEVVERVELSTGTVNRLLQTLIGRGYVEQDKRSKTYRLGLQVLELQAANLAANQMAALARPRLRNLMLRSGRRAHLAVYRGGDHIVYIDRVDNPESIGRFVPAGRGGPLHATSLGKALLAFARPEVVEDYLAHSRREQLTSRTIVDAEALRAELAAVRERGYAVEMEESTTGSFCVGAPVFDYTGEVVAAVSIAGTREEIIPKVGLNSTMVMDEAATISELFGYRRIRVADLQ